MKKLKIDKINLSEMKFNDMDNVNGGFDWRTSIIKQVTKQVIKYTFLGGPCVSCDCLSSRPGTQDSCGLCTTNYRC